MFDSADPIRFGDLVDLGLLEVGDGYRAKLEELGNGGPLFLRAGALTEHGFVWEGLDRFESDAPVGSKLGFPEDVVITTKGNSIGRVGYVSGDAPAFVYSPHLSYWRSLSKEELLPRYLYYWSRSPKFTSQLRNLGFGTDMAPYLSLRDQLRVEIQVPTLLEQNKIADVLGVLDDKIALNRKLCASIELYLRLHYRRATGEESVRENLESVAEFHNRRRVPLSARDRENRPGSVPYYGATGVFGHVDTPIFDEQLVLVGEDGSVITEEGHPVVQYIWGPSWVNNHAHVLTGVGISTELLGVALRDADVRHLVTGAVQPKISMGKLKSLSMSFPRGEALTRLEDLCDSVMALIRSLTVETRTLAKLRDTLLPHLISGRLHVRDAEKQVEDVV